MKYSILNIVIFSFAFCSCTKTITMPAPGPTLTFKSRLTLTIGDSIKNVTVYPPFSTAAINNMNFLDPSVCAYECNASWSELSETGQPIKRGSVVQTSAVVVAAIQHGFTKCILLQYQNKETSHFSDGTSQDAPVGTQYYVIVKAE